MNEVLTKLYRASRPKEALASQDEFKSANALLGSDVEKFAESLIEKFDDILVLEYVDCVGNEDKQAEERIQRLREKVKTYFGVKE